MSKNIQNLVFLMQPSEDAFDTSFKGGNMSMNRFCIDEDAAFESSGVYYLEKSSFGIENCHIIYNDKFILERKSKGKEYFSLQQTVSMCLITFIRVNHFEFP